ncbi:hypothetical protein L208DRAFT_1378744 [Tricholoma matsutake]|nr:hypothetical protein L208DRAFT_1378744 [Tricholoma matsutake 945]
MAIQQAVHLVKLDIGEAYPLVDLLCDTPLLHLRECDLLYVVSLGRFLKNHCNMETLVVFRKPLPDTLVPLEFPSIRLPKLSYFVGPAVMVPYVLPGSAVNLASLLWGNDDNRETILASIVTCSTLQAMTNFFPIWDGDLVTTIATYLPNLKGLTLKSFQTRKLKLKEFLIAIRHSLPLFKALVILTLSASSISPSPTFFSLDKEYDMVARWGDQCPSLLVCSLPSGTKWSRMLESVWFPDIEGKHASLAAKWKVRAIASVKFPLELYYGLQDQNGDELVPQLRELISRGVRYPLRHLKLSFGDYVADDRNWVEESGESDNGYDDDSEGLVYTDEFDDGSEDSDEDEEEW